MAQMALRSIYGIEFSQEHEMIRNEKWMKYFKSKIKAFELHPEPDYDSIRQKELILEIGKSDLPSHYRKELLSYFEDDDILE